MSDRGFLHLISHSREDSDAPWEFTIERVEEEDGNVERGAAEHDTLVAHVKDASTIPGFIEPDLRYADPSGLLETEPDLPAWLRAWAYEQVEASKDTDAYRQHAAAWIGPEGDWS